MYKKPPAVPLRRNLLWAAVDLDGTIAEGIWTPDDPTHEIGPPIRANLNKLDQLVTAGWKIHIHTARPWTDYELIETWLRYWMIPYSQIHCGKLLAGIYIDDRAINAEENDWGTLPRTAANERNTPAA